MTIILDGKERNAAWTALSILSNMESHLLASMPSYAAAYEYPAERAALRNVEWAQYLLTPELYPYPPERS
jgi:hypothetical protein